MRNLITDVAGLRVGHAQDMALASGVTAILFDAPSVASIAIHGGAPGVRDTALLEPGMSVEAVDALVLSGGSAFGLDAMGGVQAFLRAQGRGFEVGAARVPIVPGAILFDLLNGGNKGWARQPPYFDLGFAAAEANSLDFDLGSVGAGLGATTVNLKGGIGSTSARTSSGYTVGALVAINAVGSVTIGDGPHFWAAPFEQYVNGAGEFGWLGSPARVSPQDLRLRIKGHALQNTTLAVVATDAPLSKAQAKRLAVQAQGGIALAIRPAHTAMDGDIVFAAGTGQHPKAPNTGDLVEIGQVATDCLARAIARGVYCAKPLLFTGALPAWEDKFNRI